MENMNRPRVALYCRVAHESQLEMDCQRESLKLYAMSLGYSRLAHYADNGASGLCFDRPGLCQLDADIQAGKIGAVLVRDISRIGRGMPQTMRWLKNAADKGIEVITLIG